MILVLYGFIALGFVLLALDVSGQLRAPRITARVFRVVGLAIAGLAAFTPVIMWWSGDIEIDPGGIFPFVAYGYVVLFALFAAGSLLFPETRPSRWLRRLAYAGLLVLAALPSFVLLPLTSVPMGIAGLALFRPVVRN